MLDEVGNGLRELSLSVGGEFIGSSRGKGESKRRGKSRGGVFKGS